MLTDTEMKVERVKVLIKCRTCNQRFILRGSPNKDGNIETGFKMCMCGSPDVDITMVGDRVPKRLEYRLKKHDDSEVI